ncbi:hypothetical protein L9F63_006063, partial [Diploptera punctata]
KRCSIFGNLIWIDICNTLISINKFDEIFTNLIFVQISQVQRKLFYFVLYCLHALNFNNSLTLSSLRITSLFIFLYLLKSLSICQIFNILFCLRVIVSTPFHLLCEVNKKPYVIGDSTVTASQFQCRYRLVSMCFPCLTAKCSTITRSEVISDQSKNSPYFLNRLQHLNIGETADHEYILYWLCLSHLCAEFLSIYSNTHIVMFIDDNNRNNENRTRKIYP